MSKFSGKCDICDVFIMIGPELTEEELNKEIAQSDFYISLNNRYHKLDIKNIHDLIPYYPYLESMASAHRLEDGTLKHSIVLSSKSFVDLEEEDMLETQLSYIKKAWRKCKRNKTDFTRDNPVFYSMNDKLDDELFKRVVEQGEKATIEGLHRNIHEYYRTELYNEMISNGYSDLKAYYWCFGEHDPNKSRLFSYEDNK